MSVKKLRAQLAQASRSRQVSPFAPIVGDPVFSTWLAAPLDYFLKPSKPFSILSLPFAESPNHIFDDSPTFKTNGIFSFLPWFLKPRVGTQLRKALVLLLSS